MPHSTKCLLACACILILVPFVTEVALWHVNPLNRWAWLQRRLLKSVAFLSFVFAVVFTIQVFVP